jgi:hypothetical protein
MELSSMVDTNKRATISYKKISHQFVQEVFNSCTSFLEPVLIVQRHIASMIKENKKTK